MNDNTVPFEHNNKVESLKRMGYTVTYDPYENVYGVQIRIGDFGYMYHLTGEQMRNDFIIEIIVANMNKSLNKLLKGM